MQDFDRVGYDPKQRRMRKRMKEEQEEGVQIFIDHFQDLWD